MAKKEKTEKQEMQGKNIGIDVTPPQSVCEDVHCPFHGSLSVRGRVFEGRVVSAKAQRTAIIEREYSHFIPKFERYERRHSRITVHKPDCMQLKEGDRVKIAECRPLSKTKSFVVVEVLK